MTALLLLAALAAGAPPATYDVRPGPGARFALIVEKTGLWSGRRHVFEFQKYSGTVRLDGDDPPRSQVEFTIDAASATCNDAWVSEKDRAKVLAYMMHDMLDVEHHPRLTFRSTAVTPAGGKSYEVAGMLGVRGIERPVKVAVTLNDGSASGHAIVRIRDYGLKPPKAALGAIGTRDEMTVEFRVLLRAL